MLDLYRLRILITIKSGTRLRPAMHHVLCFYYLPFLYYNSLRRFRIVGQAVIVERAIALKLNILSVSIHVL